MAIAEDVIPLSGGVIEAAAFMVYPWTGTVLPAIVYTFGSIGGCFWAYVNMDECYEFAIFSMER